MTFQCWFKILENHHNSNSTWLCTSILFNFGKPTGGDFGEGSKIQGSDSMRGDLRSTYLWQTWLDPYSHWNLNKRQRSRIGKGTHFSLFLQFGRFLRLTLQSFLLETNFSLNYIDKLHLDVKKLSKPWTVQDGATAHSRFKCVFDSSQIIIPNVEKFSEERKNTISWIKLVK